MVFQSAFFEDLLFLLCYENEQTNKKHNHINVEQIMTENNSTYEINNSFGQM